MRDLRKGGAALVSAAALGSLAIGNAIAGDNVSPAAASAPASPAVTALHCGHFIDTAAGKTLGATTIVIEGARVRDVASGTQTPPGAPEIDLMSQTCMPGLIDSH